MCVWCVCDGEHIRQTDTKLKPLFPPVHPCRHFEVKDKDNEGEASKIFSVPDFVGDACKAIASRIRGAVAGVQFDDFHKVHSLAGFIWKIPGGGGGGGHTSIVLTHTHHAPLTPSNETLCVYTFTVIICEVLYCVFVLFVEFCQDYSCVCVWFG